MASSACELLQRLLVAAIDTLVSIAKAGEIDDIFEAKDTRIGHNEETRGTDSLRGLSLSLWKLEG
jgi:hypothetical protein